MTPQATDRASHGVAEESRVRLFGAAILRDTELFEAEDKI